MNLNYIICYCKTIKWNENDENVELGATKLIKVVSGSDISDKKYIVKLSDEKNQVNHGQVETNLVNGTEMSN